MNNYLVPRCEALMPWARFQSSYGANRRSVRSAVPEPTGDLSAPLYKPRPASAAAQMASRPVGAAHAQANRQGLLPYAKIYLAEKAASSLVPELAQDALLELRMDLRPLPRQGLRVLCPERQDRLRTAGKDPHGGAACEVDFGIRQQALAIGLGMC